MIPRVQRGYQQLRALEKRCDVPYIFNIFVLLMKSYA